MSLSDKIKDGNIGDGIWTRDVKDFIKDLKGIFSERNSIHTGLAIKSIIDQLAGDKLI